MDDRQAERWEQKSGVVEGIAEGEEREGNGREQEGTAQEVEGRVEDLASRAKRMQRRDMEITSFSLSASQERDGPVRRFLEGELVEVRQREKGLRGSWHPAVVTGVKLGRRVVEYDELLTDDGREKLTENIPVGRWVDGGRLGVARQSWKSPAKRPRTFLRPRPPPLPEISSISWAKGLSVDCYFKDAWWEGVLTETISSSSRQKRAWVWFPEEEDWESMPVKDMRVAQQWDEETGEWSLKGCVDIPASKLVNRSKTMSLSGKPKGFSGSRRRRSVDSMEMTIALKIEGTNGARRDVEYPRTCYNVDRTKEDPNVVIPVQRNSPKNSAFTPCQTMSHRSSGDFVKQPNSLPLALRTRSSDWSPRQLRSPRGRRLAESLFGGRSFREDNDITTIVDEDEEDQERIANSGGTVDNERVNDHRLGEFGERRRVDIDNGNAVEEAIQRLGQLGLLNRLSDLDILDNLSPEEINGVIQLLVEGWRISRSKKKNSQYLDYRAPNGLLHGSLRSALELCEKMKKHRAASGDDENPTLRDILTPKSGKGSLVIKGRFASGRKLKDSRRTGSPTSVKEGGREMDLLEPNNAGYVHGEMVSGLGPSAGSNVRATKVDSTVSFVSNFTCKRSATDSGFISDDSTLIDLKRRKVQDFPVGQNGAKTLSNGEGGGPATETRSKKRAFVTEGIRREQGNDLFGSRNVDEGPPFRGGSMEWEPMGKTRITTEVCTPSEGKSKKSLAILQESSRKRGSTPHKGGESKQVKKGTTQVKKTASQVKKGKKSRTPARKTGVRLEVVLSSPGSNLTVGDGDLKKKRTLLSWLIDNGTVSEHDKVRYLHRIDLHCMNEGYVTRDGILCTCCKRIVTLSVFEAHAGSKLHRPSANIFLDDGRSLSVCQIAALAVKQDQTDKGLGDLDKSDDTCGICGDGGQLICCDHCPSTFHINCMRMQEVPDGDWFCPNCRCASCGGSSRSNADPTTFNDLTVVLCDQCECEYHVKCLRARGFNLDSFPRERFFCGDSCGRIFQGLRSLVGICKPMQGGFSWTLLRSAAEADRTSDSITNTEIIAEHDSKISIALSVMQECFRPMIDPRTKIDIITHVLYNRSSEVSRLNYCGFYTMLLERGDELISVATIRVHGARLAEMPLIGTRFTYRRQGMCRKLMSAIEEMLYSLGVERLVLPAVPELLDTWTGAFGFKPMDESERLELMDLNIMAFPGTSILYKRLENLSLRSEEPHFDAVEQSRCPDIGQPRLDYSDAAVAAPPVIVKRGRGRPPKVKEESSNWNNGLALTLTRPILDRTTRQAESPVAFQPTTVKRGRGRPPRNSKAQFKPRDEEKLADSMAIVAAHQLPEANCNAGYAFSPRPGCLGQGRLFDLSLSMKRVVV